MNSFGPGTCPGFRESGNGSGSASDVYREGAGICSCWGSCCATYPSVAGVEDRADGLLNGTLQEAKGGRACA